MTVAAIVLAAGRATRFGATKQLAIRAGQPLVAHPVQAALDGGVDEVVVVVGHDADAVRAAVPENPRVRLVLNPRYAEGQSTSLAAGLAALPPDADVAVILLADEPDVRGEAVAAVAGACTAETPVARAYYADGPGHPVAWAQSTWPRLSAVSGDQGARDILTELEVAAVPVPGYRPRDVDVPGDL